MATTKRVLYVGEQARAPGGDWANPIEGAREWARKRRAASSCLGGLHAV